MIQEEELPAEDNPNSPTNQTEDKEPVAAQVHIINQFIRDVSFENFAAQKAVNQSIDPEVQVNINLNARKINEDNQFEVITKLRVGAKNKAKDNEEVFLIELDYAGLFKIENVPDDQMHPFLLIECPRLLFPFMRRIVSDLSRDGGFPPLNLDIIDFMQLYRQELQRRVQEKSQEKQD